jgi:hypothetical protein
VFGLSLMTEERHSDYTSLISRRLRRSSGNPRKSKAMSVSGVERKSDFRPFTSDFDPHATLAVHRGDGFDGGLAPIKLLD